MPAKEDKKRIKPVIEEVIAESVEPEISPQPVEEQVEVDKAEVDEVATPSPKPENKTNIKLVVIITVVSALVAAVVSGGVYVYLSGVESLGEEVEATPEPTSSPTPVPTETAMPEPVEVSEYSVQVLNGSGAIGAASGGEEVLGDAGFEVDATGNASNYNFENTVVQAKSEVPAGVIGRARKALEENDYEVELGEALPASSKYDIVVTVGSN